MGGNDGHPARVRHHLDNQGGYARHLWAETAVGGATWTDLNSSLAPDHKNLNAKTKKNERKQPCRDVRAALAKQPLHSVRVFKAKENYSGNCCNSEKARAHEYGLVEQACVGFSRESKTDNYRDRPRPGRQRQGEGIKCLG